ncbi:hypothetical protein [Natrinema hispanicum]|uniref:DUF7981 domain-containing protein n=1 Tax=Natrinema hispanicum TaxID=392421 RepID=A0A1G6I3U4_9EURY|nr:hypothetical protein [Natrinema hispanicum]SDC01229.1 hypothetical protein SAMN05192552_1001124 [Natrinema hispanicum]SES88758.1 hypothetical protein SAMN04488694_102225 [Natrinema hispanicum]
MTGSLSALFGLEARTTSALLWGIIGCLSVLVGVQGYTLLVAPIVTITQALVLALLVGCTVAGGAYVLEPRLAVWAANRTTE